MNTPSEWATNKARELATAWYHGCGFPCDGNDLPALEAAIALALDAARRVPDGHVREGVTDRKVLGTLPITGDGHICGFPPGFGSLFGKGDHVDIDRFDPVCMWYDGQSRLIMLRVNGIHGGMRFDGVPIGNLYSTRTAAEAAKQGGE